MKKQGSYRFQKRRALFEYYSQLNKPKLETFFRNIVVPTFISIYHKRMNPAEIYTYVLIDFGHKYDTRNKNKFVFANVVPDVKTMHSDKDWATELNNAREAYEIVISSTLIKPLKREPKKKRRPIFQSDTFKNVEWTEFQLSILNIVEHMEPYNQVIYWHNIMGDDPKEINMLISYL